MTLNAGDVLPLDDRMVVGPGLFQAMGQDLHRLGPIAPHDQKTYCRCTESAYHPENILHYDLPPFPVTADLSLDAEECMDVDSGARLSRVSWNGYTFGYGFGALRSCAWYGSPCGSEDAGDSGGRGHVS